MRGTRGVILSNDQEFKLTSTLSGTRGVNLFDD